MKRLAWLLLGPGLLLAADMKPVDEAGFPKVVAALKGKVVLVNFWATYCVPCRKEMPALVALHQRLAPKGLLLVTISADEQEQEAQARAFLDKTGAPAPAYIRRARDDDKFVSGIDAKWNGALPYTLLYDRSGKRVKVWYGEVPLPQLEAAIAKLL